MKGKSKKGGDLSLCIVRSASNCNKDNIGVYFRRRTGFLLGIQKGAHQGKK